MGMTDKQFDAYTKSQLRELYRAQEELKQAGAESPTLNRMVKDMEAQLASP